MVCWSAAAATSVKAYADLICLLTDDDDDDDDHLPLVYIARPNKV